MTTSYSLDLQNFEPLYNGHNGAEKTGEVAMCLVGKKPGRCREPEAVSEGLTVFLL